MSQMTEFYITKEVRAVGGSTVLYLPSAWDIPPHTECIVKIWRSSEAEDDAFRCRARTIRHGSATRITVPANFGLEPGETVTAVVTVDDDKTDE